MAWGSWAGIVGFTWIAAFIIAEVIPFFSDMLSLMSSLFDGWFGYVPECQYALTWANVDVP